MSQLGPAVRRWAGSNFTPSARFLASAFLFALIMAGSGGEGNDRVDILTGKATLTSGLLLGRYEVLSFVFISEVGYSKIAIQIEVTHNKVFIACQ